MKCKNYINGSDEFTYLSKRSLDLVYEWAQKNEPSSYKAKRYLELCVCIGYYIDYRDKHSFSGGDGPSGVLSMFCTK